MSNALSPQQVEVKSQLEVLLKQKLGLDTEAPQPPKVQAEIDLVVGLTMNILEKNKTLENKYDPNRSEKLDATLSAACAAAQYFEMKLLEKECQRLEKKIADPANSDDKMKLAQELTGKLRQLNSFSPKDKQNANINKDLANPDFAKNLLEKIQQGKFKKDGMKDDAKDDKKDNKNEPTPQGADFANETNMMLLGVMNPGIITGKPIILDHIIQNSGGIVDTCAENTVDALGADAGLAKESGYTTPSPFSTQGPKGPGEIR